MNDYIDLLFVEKRTYFSTLAILQTTKLAAMIEEVKANIKAEKERLKTVNEAFTVET